jgi:WD40 repeat protein
MIRLAKHGILIPVHYQEVGKPTVLCNASDGISSVSWSHAVVIYLRQKNTKRVLCIDAYVFYYGTSRNVLGMIDVRSASSVQSENTEFQPHPISPDVQVTNDAMINSLYVSRDGIHVITGDSKGAVKVWDVRAR